MASYRLGVVLFEWGMHQDARSKRSRTKFEQKLSGWVEREEEEQQVSFHSSSRLRDIVKDETRVPVRSTDQEDECDPSAQYLGSDRSNV